MALLVRGHGQRGRTRGRQPQGGLADLQQGPRGQGDRPAPDRGAVEGGAVGRVEVGHGDPAVAGHRHGAVHPGHVGVVQRDVGLGGPADPDLPAVQQVHPARVGSGHDVQLGCAEAVLGQHVRHRGVQRQHRAVHQRRLAQHPPLEVEALGARVQHDRAPGVGAADGGREPGGDRGQRGAGGRGDEHVTARGGGRGLVAAARPEDGQPDLHRRQRSLLRGARCVRPAGDPVTRVPDRPHPARTRRPVRSARKAGLPSRAVPYGCILAPVADNTPGTRQ